MRYSSFPSFLVMAALPLAAQTPATKSAPANTVAAKSAKAFTPPKTPWGDPDIQGQWPATANIPMQRPLSQTEKSQLTPEELKQREAQFARQAAQDAEEFVASGGSLTINPPGYWVEHSTPHQQASLVVDPPNGRIPDLTPEAQARNKALRGGLGPGDHFPKTVNSWEDFDMYSRCVSRGLLSSMLPTLYNFGNQIIQGPGYVAIRNEMIHETRVVPLDGRPHVSSNIKSYLGDSRGHWEGNTLVVESTNFNGKIGIGGSFVPSDQLKIVERFTRVAADELSYDATITDPGSFTAPWTIHMPYKLDPHYVVYEYACHEGNYMMLNALKGARQLETQGRDSKVSNDNFVRPITQQ
jgi:hypothetical protein